MTTKKTSTIHRAHAMKLAKAVNERTTVKGAPLEDDELMQAIEDCFGSDDSVSLHGNATDDLSADMEMAN